MIYEMQAIACVHPSRKKSPHWPRGWIQTIAIMRRSEAEKPKRRNNLEQQGMNAKFDSLCKRSSNLITQLCVNIMQFSDPNAVLCVHSIKFLGHFLSCDACNAIVLLFLLCCFVRLNDLETLKWTTLPTPMHKGPRISFWEQNSAFYLQCIKLKPSMVYQG